jgi:ribonuclease HI
LLWVLHEIIKLTNPNEMNVTIYTDSQNIINLPNRQARLERSNYFSSKNKRLNDYELYQQFYHLTSKLDCRLVKVIGHRNSSSKDQIDKLFALVDKASRKALRKEF